jgi:hypothetical protein
MLKRNGLDQQKLLDILSDVCEKGEQLSMLEAKDIIQELVSRLKPVITYSAERQDIKELEESKT